LYALTSFFGTNPDADFDDLNKTHSFHFLTVFRQTLFPPACLAFKHLIEGGLFLFEKQLLSEALYRLFRECLPQTIPNNEVFLYTPYMFYANFQKAQFMSEEHDGYEQVLLCKLCSGGDTQHEKDLYFDNPVSQLSNSNGKFELVELEKSTEAKDTYINQTDLKVFMNWLKTCSESQMHQKIT
jgi:hypothetical protein